MADSSLRLSTWLSCAITTIILLLAGAQSLTAEADSETDRAVGCLAANIYHEARGEILEGQVGIANVVMNRVRDHRWPDTVCEVVYQPYQFSWTAGNPVIDDVQAWSIAYAIASGAVSGELVSMVGPANHYHAITVAPKWAENMKRIRRINNHIFYLDEGFAI